MINTAVFPRLLYRTECLPLTGQQLQAVSSLLEKIIFGVMGLPSLVARKTLYTPQPRAGAGFFPYAAPH